MSKLIRDKVKYRLRKQGKFPRTRQAKDKREFFMYVKQELATKMIILFDSSKPFDKLVAAADMVELLLEITENLAERLKTNSIVQLIKLKEELGGYDQRIILEEIMNEPEKLKVKDDKYYLGDKVEELMAKATDRELMAEYNFYSNIYISWTKPTSGIHPESIHLVKVRRDYIKKEAKKRKITLTEYRDSLVKKKRTKEIEEAIERGVRKNSSR